MSSKTEAQARRVRDLLARTFRPNVVPVDGVVQSVQRGANRAADSATVVLANGQSVKVPTLGLDLRDGQAVAMERDVNKPTSPSYRIVGTRDSLTPFPQLEADFEVDPPAWLTPAITSRALAATAGGQQAEVTVHLRETPEDQGPREMVIFYKLAGASAWQQAKVPNVGGQDAEQHATLPGTYPLGGILDAYAVTYTYGKATSPPTEVRTHVISGDLTTPSPPAGSSIAVDLNINLTALVRLPAPSQPLVFDHWEIRVAGDAAGGAGSFTGLLPATYETPGRERLITLPQPGPIFIRVREVTRSGTPGGWWPSSGFAGPYNVVANDVVVDTTPPPTPTIASVVASAGFDANGIVVIRLLVTLGLYTVPADFDTFIYSFHNGDVWLDRPSTQTVYQEDYARPGITYQVRVRAVDKAGNSSAYSTAFPIATPAVTQPAQPAAPPTVQQVPNGILVRWAAVTATTGSGQIVQYDLQRSTDGTNWTDVTSARVTSFVDAGLPLGTSYRYRYRARNANGNPGPYSTASAQIQPGAPSNADFAANQIDANHVLAHGSVKAPLLEGDLVLASTIRANGIGSVAGRIFAGARALLYHGGLALNNAASIAFRSGDLENGTDVATLGAVANYQGGGKSGVLIDVPQAGTPFGVLFIRTRTSEPDGARWVEVSDQEVRFRRPTGGFAMTGSEIQVPSTSRGGTIVRLAHQRTITGVATLLSFAASDFGIPSADRHLGIMCRITNLCGAGSFAYLYPFNGDQEDGLFAAHGDTVGGFAPSSGPALFGNQWHLQRVGGASMNVVLSITAYVA